MSISNSTLTQARLRELLSYNPETGLFTWRIQRARIPAGKQAGSICGGGYMGIMIADVRYSSHRLAWFYMHGVWPLEIDHINRDRRDNRISNLREVTRSQNNQNKRREKRASSAALGVRMAKTPGKWHASIVRARQRCHLGTFDSFDAAKVAYEKALQEWDAQCKRELLTLPKN